MKNTLVIPVENYTQNINYSNLQPESTVSDIPVFKIGDNVIYLKEVFNYLNVSGELPRFLLEVARQYFIAQEIKQQIIGEPSLEILEQFILELRLQQGLTTLEKFQSWLAEQGLSYPEFRQKIEYLIQLDILKKKIAETQIEDYFVRSKDELTRLILARIVVEKPEIAEEIKQKLVDENFDFTQLAKEYSVVDDAVIGGVMGAVARGDMPEVIYNATANASAGQIIGPIPIENRLCLLKVEEVIIPTFDDAMKQELTNKLFDEWLKTRLQEVNIQLMYS